MRGLLLAFALMFSAAVSARPPVSATTPASSASMNADVFERRLSQLEEALAPITAKAEEMAHAQKTSQDANSIAVRDLQLQIKELGLKVREMEMTVQNLSAQVARVETDYKDRLAAAVSALTPAASKEAKKEEAVDTESAVFLEATRKFNAGDYQGAITQFIENMRKYPEGVQFYDNMFYLALSMSALDRKADACNTLKVLTDSGNALERGLKARVVAEAERLKCNE